MNKLYPWQDELWQRWAGLRARLPHAVLLKGAQGIGKFDFAMNIARSLLCEQPPAGGLACDGCSSCHWFQQQTHPDFRLIQPDALSAQEEESEGGKKPARQISVDQIRALADFSSLSAHQGGYRVVLIHPAETMNANAANALLKTLEEPSGRMLFILVTHKPQQLPPTILSRCLALAAPLPPPETSAAWLKQQGVDDQAALLAQAGFAPLRAARLAEEAEEDAAAYRHFLQEIGRPAQFDVFALAEQLQRTEPARVIHWLQQWCCDLGSAKLAGKVLYHIELADTIRNLAGKVMVFDLLRYQKELLVARREAAHPLNPRLLFESLLLSYRNMMLGGAA
ncbi:MAG: DNA polymerase III subunit delta' [Nitrosomonadales bacterium]|nr:DNA polymerase III subunit delta' [Nitrosomonadales bacterium]